MPAKKTLAKFQTAYDKAMIAGQIAGEKARPRAIVVSQHASVLDDKSPPIQQWYEPEGLCGFAWVRIVPGNSPFANWLKKNGHARKAYGGGVDIWIGDFGQSVERKEACARAIAETLRTELDVKAYAESRLD